MSIVIVYCSVSKLKEKAEGAHSASREEEERRRKETIVKLKIQQRAEV